jgi:serine/threonine protein kinase
VKVFDFGLCKTLSSNLKARDGGYGYRLTGKAGSLPYMAPEVCLMKTYDTKCDVFSFAMLLWEMLSGQPAFDNYSATEFVDHVAVGKERPPVPKTWPPLTRLMIPEAWDDDPSNRPDMKRVAILIRGDLNDLTTDDRVLHRTKHLQNRSNHSFTEGGDDGDEKNKLL